MRGRSVKPQVAWPIILGCVFVVSFLLLHSWLSTTGYRGGTSRSLGVGLLSGLKFPTLDKVLQNGVIEERTSSGAPVGSFSVEEASRQWLQEVGCQAFRERHKSLIDRYDRIPPVKWPKRPSLQDVSKPKCRRLRLPHVTVYVTPSIWLKDSQLENFHYCPRCGISCQFTWAETMAVTADAVLHVDNREDSRASSRREGDPLLVFMSLEPNAVGCNMGKKLAAEEGGADIEVGFHQDCDVQATYAGIATQWQHYISPTKREDVLVFQASSHCVEWREMYLMPLLDALPHHSFGECQNNMGGKGKEEDLYHNCTYKKEMNAQRQEITPCVMSHYKFHLGVENTRTNGYVTEKLLAAFSAGTVPIYLGAPDVQNFVPPESIIDAQLFPSPEDLANHVKEVGRDPMKYMNYFAWRMCGVMGNFSHTQALGFSSLACRVCERVSALGGRNMRSIML